MIRKIIQRIIIATLVACAFIMADNQLAFADKFTDNNRARTC